MSRYEKASTVLTSNRGLDDWAKLLGDVVVVGPLLDRFMHHGHLLKFDGKSWRLKEAAARMSRVCRAYCHEPNNRLKYPFVSSPGVGEFDPTTGGGV